MKKVAQPKKKDSAQEAQIKDVKSFSDCMARIFTEPDLTRDQKQEEKEKIIAFILNAPQPTLEEIKSIIDHFTSEGSDIFKAILQSFEDRKELFVISPIEEGLEKEEGVVVGRISSEEEWKLQQALLDSLATDDTPSQSPSSPSSARSSGSLVTIRSED